MKNLVHKLKKFSLLLAIPLFFPQPAFAAYCSATSGVQLAANPKIADVINFFTCLLANSVVPLLITVAIVIFIWGMVQFITNSDNEEKRQKGRQFMVWGIVALFMIVSVWGLVRILTNTFNISFGLPQLSQ